MSSTSDPLIPYINVKLALLGAPPVPTPNGAELNQVISTVVAQYREKERLLSNHLCPADQRIQTFLYDYLQELPVPKLPLRTLVLDRPGLGRSLSVPVDRDEHISTLLSSYRVEQGVLHNPRSDRRTTAGIFHVAEGGLPIPGDKVAVPKATFSRMLSLALSPPPDLLRLPFTATQSAPVECFVSLLLRPIVSPEVPGYSPEKTMEIRFFAPGSLVSNLDFVETIFGNAGDPGLPENDAGLDTLHWTGHTGCVILAPHLTSMTCREVDLPHWDAASDRQRADGMCWKNESDLYNRGQPFKLTCRDDSGIIITIIADNYFGYCKKEVKTQISFSANLSGSCEEEHAGGALVFPCYDLGEHFSGNIHVKPMGHSYQEMIALFPDVMEATDAGYAIDKQYPDIVYVPETAHFDLHQQRISWPSPHGEQSLKLLHGTTYVRPSGYKVRMEKPPGNRVWRLIGTVAEGLFCHKPSTVSGGGKSEISKSISDAILYGSVYVTDLKHDLVGVDALINRDYSDRFRDPDKVDQRALLARERSLGSVIKLLTPDPQEYTDAYNAWLASVPQPIKELAFVVKRFYEPDWGPRWRDHFTVDLINGTAGNELKFDNRKLVSAYMRVGFAPDNSWRTFGLRKDFYPASKIQQEDDITASIVVPLAALSHIPGPQKGVAVKFVKNCEQRLFQRPDDAIHRGYDKQTESDFAQPSNFFSNYEPLPAKRAHELLEDSIGFFEFTEPMQRLIRQVASQSKPGFFVSSAHPRLVEGKPSKNPRYLQLRPDLVNPRESYLAQIATRLHRRLPTDRPLYTPVNAILPARRNNPPDGKIRSLAVFNPIHYFELPELFMEFICSMTGKSPSTTGAGSEGALTKGPFNALPSIIDLNNALVSFLLTGHDGFVTAAGFLGPHSRVDHDISLLIPEVWCRMNAEERDPQFLIANHFLDKCEDFQLGDRPILASRLGYRINERFVHAFFGRVFNHPQTVFTREMLQPELQDPAIFADGMDNIVSTQKRIAQIYFDDGSAKNASPPLFALLQIMAHDHWENKKLDHPDFRHLFTRQSLLQSDWYAARLAAKQSVDQRLWTRHVHYLSRFLKRSSHAEEAKRLGIADRLEHARRTLREIESPAYPQHLFGTLGAEPIQNYR